MKKLLRHMVPLKIPLKRPKRRPQPWEIPDLPKWHVRQHHAREPEEDLLQCHVQQHHVCEHREDLDQCWMSLNNWCLCFEVQMELLTICDVGSGTFDFNSLKNNPFSSLFCQFLLALKDVLEITLEI